MRNGASPPLSGQPIVQLVNIHVCSILRNLGASERSVTSLAASFRLLRHTPMLLLPNELSVPATRHCIVDWIRLALEANAPQLASPFHSSSSIPSFGSFLAFVPLHDRHDGHSNPQKIGNHRDSRQLVKPSSVSNKFVKLGAARLYFTLLAHNRPSLLHLAEVSSGYLSLTSPTHEGPAMPWGAYSCRCIPSGHHNNHHHPPRHTYP
ncbi:hypothetical protein LY78DRAFT_139346 [Colletotrichum sublineola]|nr:hypothetical protein LY78DRAFT_139346 [Colletotrichum sublineola]